MKFLSSAFLLSSLAIHASASAVQNDAAFLKRNLFPTVQGWALVEDTCPDGTTGCGQRTCCPTGSTCDTSLHGSNVCCPTGDSCAQAVQQDSHCADSAWVLFETNHDPLCCLPGQIAVDPTEDEDYGHCVDAGTPLTSGAITATLVGAGAITAPYSTPSWDAGDSSPSTTTAAGGSSVIVTGMPSSSALPSTKTGGGIITVSVGKTSGSATASATGAAAGSYQVAGAGLVAIAAEMFGFLIL